MWPPVGYNDKRIAVQPSTTQGFGLFALEDIPKSTLLCTFSGELTTDRSQLSDNARRYAIRVATTDFILDCEPPPVDKLVPHIGWACFANSDLQPNARRDYVEFNAYQRATGQKQIKRTLAELMPPVLCLVSLNTIPAGQEICWNYPCHL